MSGIDIRPAIEPGFRITIDPIAGGVLARDGFLTGRVTDTLAAISGVKVVYNPSGGFNPGGGTADNPKTVVATLSCDAARQICTWKAAAPPKGTWTARATRHGRRQPQRHLRPGGLLGALAGDPAERDERHARRRDHVELPRRSHRRTCGPRARPRRRAPTARRARAPPRRRAWTGRASSRHSYIRSRAAARSPACAFAQPARRWSMASSAGARAEPLEVGARPPEQGEGRSVVAGDEQPLRLAARRSRARTPRRRSPAKRSRALGELALRLVESRRAGWPPGRGSRARPRRRPRSRRPARSRAPR